MSVFSTTGEAELPDVGELSYNGCTFSCLFSTKLSARHVPDAANRTTRYVEWTLSADGYVTLQDQETQTDSSMTELRQKLQVPGGTLKYSGRGFGPNVINAGASRDYRNGLRDVAWGPVPKIMEFVPLGAGRGAMVKWQVVFRIFETRPMQGGVLQFNEETTVSYDEEDYSTLSIKGTLEIAMTRRTVGDRTLGQTVDDFREVYLSNVASGIDLTRFRVTRREFNISRDKRTMEWSFAAEEQPPMGNPPGIPKATGSYSVYPQKSAKIINGIIIWTCQLRCTYAVAKEQPRRLAWLAFLKLMKFRMASAIAGRLPPGAGADAAAAGGPTFLRAIPAGPLTRALRVVDWYARTLRQRVFAEETRESGKAFLREIRIDEGMHQDSRTITFTATWSLFTSFAHILLASGIWRWTPDALGGENWATSVRNISGWRGNLENTLNPTQDVIVDFGGPPIAATGRAPGA